jgi:DNA-binding phage protein
MAKARVDEIDPTLSEFVQSVIARRKLSGAAVAAAAGVSSSVVHRFLSHDRSMTVPSFERITTALGLKLVEGRGGLR